MEAVIGIWNKYQNRKVAETQLNQMLNAEWVCSSCSEKHNGLFDLAAFAPDFWEGEENYSTNSEVRLEGNFLSEDFCVIDGESFFVRSVLDFPIKKHKCRFGFGVWSTLSKTNFQKYIDGFDAGSFPTDTQWTEWFSNQIKGIENTIRQECWVIPQINRQRPLIKFMDEEHPVSVAQTKGLDAEWLLEIYAANGHAKS